MKTKQFRSLLFVPASRLDLAKRAHERGADAVILDLEDGVAAADKDTARNALNTLLKELEQQGVVTLVRINSLASDGALDIEAIDNSFSPALLIPKVTNPAQVLAVEESWLASGKELPTLHLLPMIECPKGMFSAQQIAGASEHVRALVFGSEDFAAEAGTSTDIEALAMPAQWVALAAAAAGISSYGLPGSLANYHDMQLFEATVRRAKSIGFTGSLCIHPKQVTLANEVFQPSDQDIEWAEAVVAQAGNGGATGGNMGMVDAPVLARAKAILASR